MSREHAFQMHLRSFQFLRGLIIVVPAFIVCILAADEQNCLFLPFCYVNNRHEFLDPGESVILISMVKKIQKLTNKKVQLILTDKPKLIYVDPAKLIVKGNIIWSDNPNDLSIQVTSSTHFKIVTPKKVLSFEDAKQRAWQWKKAIEGLQNR
eukprot:TRINITY_DN3850_c1_g1_i1.p1 TRINITY_DN3850_c1_g1~~TRINITY_DN3850_c1_g1_i1.p1  ORF type:complete len:152 (-),score=14.97 TRINITY_DN3850_c1_g1_i1:648-1103(-)